MYFFVFYSHRITYNRWEIYKLSTFFIWVVVFYFNTYFISHKISLSLVNLKDYSFTISRCIGLLTTVFQYSHILFLMEYILYINNMSSLSVVGSLFATLSSTELLFTACSQLIYGVVYKWSVSFFPGLAFLIMASVLVIALLFSM